MSIPPNDLSLETSAGFQAILKHEPLLAKVVLNKSPIMAYVAVGVADPNCRYPRWSRYDVRLQMER